MRLRKPLVLDLPRRRLLSPHRSPAHGSSSGHLHGDGCRLALMLSAITARFGPSVTVVALVPASSEPVFALMRQIFSLAADCGSVRPGGSLAVRVNFTGPVLSEHEQDRTKAV